MNTVPSSTSSHEHRFPPLSEGFAKSIAHNPDTAPRVHDGVYSPKDIIAFCEAERAEIARRQQAIADIDVPV